MKILDLFVPTTNKFKFWHQKLTQIEARNVLMQKDRKRGKGINKKWEKKFLPLRNLNFSLQIKVRKNQTPLSCNLQQSHVCLDYQRQERRFKSYRLWEEKGWRSCDVICCFLVSRLSIDVSLSSEIESIFSQSISLLLLF